jgi:hypothetical protein
MIAEADPAQALTIINNLRTVPIGLPDGIDRSAWPLATISAAEWAALTPAEQVDALLEERRRELYLQGVKIGDDLRHGNTDTWDTGVSLVNAPIGDLTCLPAPEIEFL